MKRKAISDKMKWQCLLYRRPEPCPLCFKSMGPLSKIQWDHVWEVADDGPHTYQNLRPICVPCHRKKSAKATTMRAHINRLIRGKKKSKRPMKSRKAKWPKRGFPKRDLRDKDAT